MKKKINLEVRPVRSESEEDSNKVVLDFKSFFFFFFFGYRGDMFFFLSRDMKRTNRNA